VDIRKTFQEKCRKGNHPFKEIYRNGSDLKEDVVRWCPVCGTVVIDVDFDGRTNPGQAMKARRPKVLEAAKESNAAR
jgi:hypothetical protein